MSAVAPARWGTTTADAAIRMHAEMGNWHIRDAAIMGTAIRVELWSEDAAAGEAACDAVIAEMHRIDARYSPHKPESELSIVNREAGERAVPLSDEMFELVVRAQRFSELSHGAFDITYAGIGHLFDYREGVRPTEAQLAQARRSVGFRQLLLDREARTLRFGLSGMRIDLGGFAKGHAVDTSIAILQRRGIEHAMVSAGGDSHVLGDRRGRPWSVAIADPRRQGEFVAVLPLVDTAISTSGDYERFFERDGVRYHHIIDPATGRSPDAVRSVTVLAPNGLTSEALSKTVFVLGVERGLAIVERIPGADAVVVDAAGQLHHTAGFSRGN